MLGAQVLVVVVFVSCCTTGDESESLLVLSFFVSIKLETFLLLLFPLSLLLVGGVVVDVNISWVMLLSK